MLKMPKSGSTFELAWPPVGMPLPRRQVCGTQLTMVCFRGPASAPVWNCYTEPASTRSMEAGPDVYSLPCPAAGHDVRTFCCTARMPVQCQDLTAHLPEVQAEVSHSLSAMVPTVTEPSYILHAACAVPLQPRQLTFPCSRPPNHLSVASFHIVISIAVPCTSEVGAVGGSACTGMLLPCPQCLPEVASAAHQWHAFSVAHILITYFQLCPAAGHALLELS